MAKKAKKPEAKVMKAAKKETFVPLTLNPEFDGKGKPEPELQPDPVVETDSEEMSEAEVAAMQNRQEKRKEEFQERLGLEVDSQDWSLADPVIPEELAGRVWIAVYRCPEGHKTKATNRQADSGVWCWKHRSTGEKIMATIMPQFLERPVNEDPNVAKRKKAAKGAQ